MKKVINHIAPVTSTFLILFVLHLSTAVAQHNEDSGSLLQDSDYQLFQNKPEFGVQLGSSFGTFGSGNSIFSQSVAPHVSWDMNERFSLTAGTILSSYNLGSGAPMVLSGNGQMSQSPRKLSSTFYAFGTYRLNTNLTISGGAWTERNNMNMVMQNQMNPQAFNLNSSGMMMGLDYKISENFRVGAEFSISNGGYNPFNPYYNTMNPMHNSPFDRRRAW